MPGSTRSLTPIRIPARRGPKPGSTPRHQGSKSPHRQFAKFCKECPVTIEKVMTVLLVHGEGDRATVNALPPHLSAPPDEPPHVTVLLVDEDGCRLEWPVKTWDEVEDWKALAGWDAEKRHWRHGATVTLALS